MFYSIRFASYCMGLFFSTKLLGHCCFSKQAYFSSVSYCNDLWILIESQATWGCVSQYFCCWIISLLHNYMLLRSSFTLFDNSVYVFKQFALPHIMGWDQALTSHPVSPSAPASRPRMERPNPDSEWDRWSFLVAPDQRRVSNTTASRHWIVWEYEMLGPCFFPDQLSEMFVSDFMVLKGPKLGWSTTKPFVCSVRISILHDLHVVSCAWCLPWCKSDAYVVYCSFAK